MGWLAGWGFRKPILYGSVFPGSNLSDFPLYVNIAADSDIATVLSGGGGITVTSADGETEVPFGLYPETDESTGDIILRFKTDLLTAASTGDVIGFIYYDAGGTTTEDKAGTVSNGYALFMPLEEDPSGVSPQMYDWVTETNVGTSIGSMTSGDLITAEVEKGLDFDGTDDAIDLGNGTNVRPAHISVEAIYKTTSSAGMQIARWRFYGWSLGFGSGHLFGGAYSSSSTNVSSSDPSTSNDGAFHSGVYTWDGTTGVLYRDGTSVDSDSTTPGDLYYDSNPLGGGASISRDGNVSGGEFAGTIDEFRISSVARTADWLAYAHANDFTPEDTTTLGPEEDVRGGLFTNLVAAWESNQASGGITDDYHDYDLTDHNGVGSATGKVYALARSYNGTSQYQSIASNPSLQVGDASVTIEAWVKFVSTAADGQIAGKWNFSGSAMEYLLGYTSGAGRLFFGITESGHFGGNSKFIQADNFGAPPTGVWIHVIGKLNTVTNEISIRVNNGAPNIDTCTFGTYVGNTDFVIGATPADSNNYFSGLIGPVRMWKGRCTTDGEDNRLWNNGNGLALASFGGPGDVGVGLKLWLDASIQQYADNDPVPTWADGSGQGNDAVQATSGARPSYQTNELNGKPVVRFDGTNDELISPLTLPQPMTWFAVYVPRMGSFGAFVPVIDTYNGNANRPSLYIDSDGKFHVHGGSSALNSTTAPSTGVAVLHGAVWDSTDEQYIDGTLEGSGASGSGTASRFTLASSGGQNFSQYDIAEVIVYDSALPDARRGAVESYLTAKWFGGGGGTTYPESYSGSCTPSASLVRAVSKLLAGSETASASLRKQVSKPLAGSETPSATLDAARAVLKALSGSTAPSGTVIRVVSKPLVGSSTPSASVVKTVQKPLASSSTPSGSFSGLKVVLRTLTASVTASASLIKTALKSLAGSSTPSATLRKSIQKPLAGSSTPSGSLSTLKAVFLSLSGVVTATGSLLRRILKSVFGSSTPTTTLETEGGSVPGTGGPMTCTVGLETPMTCTVGITTAELTGTVGIGNG